jgi:uncharacterized protein
MGEADQTLRVVFDCNVLLQAAANPNGPAAACMDFVRSGRLLLIVHKTILAEFKDVASRPKVAAKLGLTDEIAAAFVEDLLTHAEVIDHAPAVFSHPTDTKDSIYVNVALSAGAAIITIRDHHLLSLVDPTSAEGVACRSQFPNLDILTPPQLLARARSA